MTFSNLVPDPLPKDSAYIPRIFGFRVHMSARQRASGASNASSASSASANRQQQQQANIAENNRRSSSVGRRSLEAKDKIEPSTAIPAETAHDQAVAGGGRKGGTATNALATTSSVSKQGIEEDSSAKKTKSGKRKNDNESGSSNNNISKKSNGDKRRRKAENWQQQFIAWINETTSGKIFKFGCAKICCDFLCLCVELTETKLNIIIRICVKAVIVKLLN